MILRFIYLYTLNILCGMNVGQPFKTLKKIDI